MSLKDLNILPGLFTLETDRGAKARWKDGDWVRFWRGMPEKIGGYQRNGSSTFTGKARAAMDWTSLALERFIGIGTHLKLYAWKGGAYTDITPIRSTVTLASPPFSMTNTSTTVTVTHVAHGALDGDYVTYSGAAAAGGITIDGEYQLTYVDVDTYTITHSAAATSTTTGGGAAVSAAYQIHVGGEDTVAGYGWGASTYGSSTYGTPRSSSNFVDIARIWSLDNWGEDLIACPRYGGIYVWDTSAGTTNNRATVISGAPSTALAIFVSDENRHLVALGAHDGSANDPLLVRWCDSEDYTSWTASDTNTAGRKRLDGGNEILCAVKGKGETLIFTDAYFWSMTFDGPPYTFGWNRKGRSEGIRGPNAAKEYDGRVFWMGKRDFHVYDGARRVLPCDVLNHVFDDFNETQAAKVFAGANREFGEVWWLYCTEDSDECDAFVLFNVVEGTWSFGTLARTAYVGDSETFTNAYAFGADYYLYDHEYGVDANGSAQSAYLESGDIEIAEGDEVMFIDKVVPDFKRLTGTADFTLKAREYPQSSEQISKGPYAVTSTTKFINPHIRGRQIAIRLAVDAIGDDFRVGRLRIDPVPDGGI